MLASGFDHVIALHDRGEFDEAVPEYERILNHHPHHLGLLFNYGSALLHLRRFEDALQCYEKVLSVQPRHVKALTNKGVALHHLGRTTEELDAYQFALRYADDDEAIELHYNRSCAHLQKGDFARGWAEHEWRVPRDRQRQFDKPRWTGEQMEGKTVLLWAEQGFGDTLQFCRYASLVAKCGADVVLQVPPALVDLMCSLDGNFGVISLSETVSYDYHCPLLSLPPMCGTTLHTIPNSTPYLFADPAKVSEWQSRLRSDRTNVGLVWSGNLHLSKPHVNWIAKLKSFDCEKYAPLFDASGCEFHSLQKDASPTLSWITDHASDLVDFSDTAALVAALDLVISVDTSVAHLAGALGKPVWILLPFAPCWRWMLDRSDSPWYPTATLFRQGADHEWPSVIGRIKQRLIDVKSLHNRAA